MTTKNTTETAVSTASPNKIKPYLPLNFTVRSDGKGGSIITGVPKGGYTLDGYVIPRLGSGLIGAEKVVEEVEDYPEIESIGTLNDRVVQTTTINGKRYNAEKVLKEFGENPVCKKNGLIKLGGSLFLNECDFYVKIYCPHGARSIILLK